MKQKKTFALVGCFLWGFLMILPLTVQANDVVQTQTSINLLKPIGSSSTIAITPGFGTFGAYFADSATFIMEIAMGVCLIWVTVSGFMIMSGNGDLNRQGKTHIVWAIGGVLLLAMSSLILKTLNSVGFS